MVTEYVESRPLSEHLARLHAPSRVGDPAVRRWVREVAAALEHAHGLGVAHGEVGPESVLVRSGDGRAVLGGFAHGGGPGEPGAGRRPGTCRRSRGCCTRSRRGPPAPSRALAAIGGHPERPLPPLTLHGRPLPAELEAALQRGLAGAQEAGQGSAGALAAAYLEATERSPSRAPGSIAGDAGACPPGAPGPRAPGRSPHGLDPRAGRRRVPRRGGAARPVGRRGGAAGGRHAAAGSMPPSATR